MSKRRGSKGSSSDNNGQVAPKKSRGETGADKADDSDTRLNQQLLRLLSTQNDLLRSIDARLQRMENQGQRLGGRLSRIQETRTTRMIVPGSWKFKKSDSFDAAFKELFPGSPLLKSCYGIIDDDELILSGETYAQNSSYVHPSLSKVHNCSWAVSYESQANLIPNWSQDCNITRNVLARLVFNEEPKLRYKSGIYELILQYNDFEKIPCQDAGIIVGELEFHSTGMHVPRVLTGINYLMTRGRPSFHTLMVNEESRCGL
jgi:hypothetical protein